MSKCLICGFSITTNDTTTMELFGCCLDCHLNGDHNGVNYWLTEEATDRYNAEQWAREGSGGGWYTGDRIGR